VSSVLDPFSPATRAWFEGSFDAPTAVQAAGWPAIASGGHALLLAPTGSGKTLAAFLHAIDRLGSLHDDAPPGVRVLYISPLKALAYDVERNLRAPLVGIGRAAARLGEPFRPPAVSIRTGDTTSQERRQQLKHPGEILVTTPESLYLWLGGKARENLRSVHTVIVDEVHALAGTKRGAHLALSLERLDDLCAAPPQRVGLSATVRPVEDVARFLGGVGRDVAIVDRSSPPVLDLQIVVPVADMERPPEGPAPKRSGGRGSDAAMLTQPPSRGIWPSIHPRLLALILAHRSTIVFVNSRGLCERLAQHLNDLAGEPLVRAHHGSVSHEERGLIEEALKGGHLRGIVATSSLELGIDMGAVDLVVQVESPGSTARGLQRVGRAGHGVGEVSIGRIFPKFRGDLLEAAVVAARMQAGSLESIAVPRNPLDVLAQQIVAMVAVADWAVPDLFALVRRAFNFADLTPAVLASVLDMLSGRYPSSDFADLKPRLTWDRDRDRLSTRPGAGMVALVNGGTIPDRGLFGVFVAPDGPRVGELDEEMVHESRPGDTIVLGASTWRVQEVTRDRVLVTPAPGEPGRLPFWHGDGPGRPLELGRALGAFVREADAAGTVDWLRAHAPLDELAASNLLAYLREQKEATGTLPTDRAVTIERFRDELGDWRVCILTPFGERVHAPWALALEARLAASSGFDVQAMYGDDGIVLRFADTGEEEGELPGAESLIPEPEEVDDLLLDRLGDSSLFAARFRENAARALLLTRRRPGQRTPLWAQRLRSANLLAAAKRYPAFPIVLETYRTCLQDVFDVPALKEVLSAVRRRDLRVDEVETPSPSPFARSLVFAWVATYMYGGDAPLAERRAQALNLDRTLLAELLGQDELRQLLDGSIIADVEEELQRLAPDRRARSVDGLHDLLRQLGDLSADEIAARCDGEADAWLTELEIARRVVLVRLAGAARYVAVEDAAAVRDALGAALPPGLPRAFLEPAADPLTALVRRYARTHGPFTQAAVAVRFGLLPAVLAPVLRSLEAEGGLLRGEFLPTGVGEEWCDAEVLRRIRRRTLARARGEVAPLEGDVLARFAARWHQLGARAARGRLEEALLQLEGLAVAWSELEGRLLPARVPDFHPRQLDALGARGDWVWVGRGARGSHDGDVALYRRDNPALLPDPGEPPDGPLHRALLERLEARGASFLTGLLLAAGDPPISEALAALWDLVWLGLVTNDTFAPLRSLGRPARASGRRGVLAAAGGRWSLVSELRPAAPDPTERAHALARMLLERHGLVCRETARAEGLPGGFSAVYPVLKAMEDGGRVRRGYFVEGLGGAQFALPGAVDRLRAARHVDEAPDVRVLATTDPASPWGSVLPWPERVGPGRLRRAPGGTLVSVDGHPVLFLDAGATVLLTLPAAADPARLTAAVGALHRVAAGRRGGRIRLKRIDGEDAGGSALADALVAGGFERGYRGLALEVRR
jgi:ATP-dependent Lhr-like helicase